MKILIIQLGRIGDLLLATPAVKSIKEAFPEADIHVLAGRKAYSVIENNPLIKEIYVYDKSPLKLMSLILKLRKNNFDYLIDFKDHYSKEGRIIAGLLRAETKIGYNGKSGAVYDISIPSSEENNELHFVDRCYNALVHLGIEKPEETPKPDLYLSDDSENYLNDFLINCSVDDYITINISASQPKKMWQKEKWIELINLIGNSKPIVLSSSLSERPAANEIASACNHSEPFPSRSMTDVFSLINRSKLLITPDTSLVHVAAAFNLPVIGLYSGFDDFNKKFHPLSDEYFMIKAPKNHDGISEIEVKKVFESYLKLSNRSL